MTSTVESVAWVAAPCRVRLPPQTVRLTTAGRIACSARQLVASTSSGMRRQWYERAPPRSSPKESVDGPASPEPLIDDQQSGSAEDRGGFGNRCELDRDVREIDAVVGITSRA